MCYYCGECTATCPRQANPGEFMAAARRYAIARYDRLGLARLLYISPVFNTIFLVLLAAVLGVFLYTFHGPMPSDALRLFDFIPSEVVHNLGVVAGTIIILLALLGMTNMVMQVGKEIPFAKGVRFNGLHAVWEMMVEVLGQQRYRRDSETNAPKQSWFLQKWFIHAAMLWGFLGLFLATALDYLLELISVKPTGTWVPIEYPIRLLGTLAGILLIYGVTMAILKRLRRADESSTYSTPSDWAMLILLWLSGMTGFALELGIYLPQPAGWSYWMLLAHLIVVGELLILLPMTKFAHAIYRTVALYVHALKPMPEVKQVGAGATE
jgi:hypothetical protein